MSSSCVKNRLTFPTALGISSVYLDYKRSVHDYYFMQGFDAPYLEAFVCKWKILFKGIKNLWLFSMRFFFNLFLINLSSCLSINNDHNHYFKDESEFFPQPLRFSLSLHLVSQTERYGK